MDDAWYDELLYAVCGCVILIASLAYDRRCFWNKPKAENTKTSQRWRNRPELRTVLYCLAALQIASLPLGLFKEFQSLHDQPPPWADTFLSAFPFHVIFQTSIGIAIIIYDRRRLRREAREDDNLCPTCGYDLRATPDRCPECGSVPPKPNIPASPTPSEYLRGKR
jgi:hypothetical protein